MRRARGCVGLVGAARIASHLLGLDSNAAGIVIPVDAFASLVGGSAEAPGSFGMGDVGHYKVSLKKTTDRELIYEREFVFGNNGVILFPVATYPLLKGAFDQCHKSDNHTLTLRRNASTD